MAILQNLLSTLLIATFVLGNTACLCEASAAVDSPDVVSHAHHAIQVETSSTQACPHVDCTGNCATLPGITANNLVIMAIPRGNDLDAPITAPLVLADQILFGGSPLYSVPVHAPPALRRATPVSRFDRLLD